jgi:hypothetical protein
MPDRDNGLTLSPDMAAFAARKGPTTDLTDKQPKSVGRSPRAFSVT